MGSPLKIGLILVALAAAVSGSVLLLQGPTIKGESSADEAASGSGERAGLTSGPGENEGFAGMAAKTVK